MIGNRRPSAILTLLGLVVFATYLGVLCGARAGGHVTLGRRPASVAHEPARMHVVNLPCWDADVGAPQTVDARYVRLTGQNCARRAPRGEFSVRNLTNGFEATVFASGPGLTTDYIPLNSGGNDVVIAFDRAGGTRVERVLRLTR